MGQYFRGGMGSNQRRGLIRCMARALHGVETSASLKAVAERYGVGVKGTEVHNAKGKRRADFTRKETLRYGEYAKNDVDLTYNLFKKMGAKFPIKELKLIDLTLRMFIEPTLDLDLGSRAAPRRYQRT